MVIIDNVSYTCFEYYSDEGKVEVDYGDVDIDYRVIKNHNQITGNTTIEFGKYKQMNHQDLVEEIERLFKEEMKEVF